jgi:NADPH:quinone reductase-like Zn-dependent oxidoreductase
MGAITQHSFGDPDVLRVIEIDRPQPIPTEVLIRVHAIGLNPVEGPEWVDNGRLRVHVLTPKG